MYTAMSAFFSPLQRERLSAAIRLRTSCRAFSGDLVPQAAAALAYHAGRCALPGVRLALTSVPQNAFTGISGCHMAAAVLISSDDWRTRLNAGFAGEAFVLEATAMGLGSCWVGGSLRRSVVSLPTLPGEALLCVIAVGPPASPLSAPATRPRMTPDQLCRGNWRSWPEPFIRAATFVQQAPSAMNHQPWALMTTPSGCLALDAPRRSAVDAGVALCHAELALSTPHAWQLSDAPGEPLAVAVPRG